MPLEFALRPRFRLGDGVAPPRRRELPGIVAPIVVYWLGMAALTYGLVYAGPDEVAREQSAAIAVGRPRPRAPAPLATAESGARSLQPFRSSTAVASEPVVTYAETRAPKLAFAPSPSSNPPPPSDPAPEPYRWLFEHTPALRSHEPSPGKVSSEQHHAAHDRGGSVATCEMAVAGADQEIDLRSRQRAPDLSRDGLAGVLERGAYLVACGVPDRTTLDICVAVQRGRAVGVTVNTAPADAPLAACVRRVVARLSFPYSPQLDVTRTHFAAAR
jgi:hypothetical protein